MAYTTRLSTTSSTTLRRIAWALDIPMPDAVEKVFEYMPRVLDKRKVCGSCLDRTMCDECPFSQTTK